jgi:ATP-dependent RNA helicase DeaD
VGAIANEVGVPGKAIGAIDIYDRFTFLEVPAEYRNRILERMVNVEIRNRPVHVTLAAPSAHGGGAAAGDRKRGAGKPFRKAGKPPFKGRAASRRRKGKGKG